jgi:FAD-dependent oxidoreductase family protein
MTTTTAETSTVEYARSIPVADQVEVLVVGGGPAGIAAAIGAARTGARTLLVERYGYLGGNMTAGLVGPCMTSYSLDGSEQLIRGVFDELVRRMAADGQARHPSEVPASSPYCGFIEYGHDKVTPFEPEAVKVVAEQMCLEAGVELLYHTFVADVVTEGDAVTGVVCAGKGGLRLQPAGVVVDCSADADVAAAAGAPFEQGRETDGLTQPMTTFFRVRGVDDERVEEYVRTHPEDFRPYASIVARATAEGRFPAPRRGIGLYKTLRPGVWRINTTRILGKDGTDTRDLTAAEVHGREQVHQLMRFFREELPGFESCELLDTAAMIGVRETRRIVGEHVLSLADLQQARHFDDVIGLCGYPVDIHDPTGAGGGVDDAYRTANAYQIPYRSLVPLGVEQLLVAGRCLSATHEALAAIRVMPPAFATGHAAGVAAGLAVQGGVAPRKIPVDQLQRTLLAQDAYLGRELTPHP